MHSLQAVLQLSIIENQIALGVTAKPNRELFCIKNEMPKAKTWILKGLLVNKKGGAVNI